MTRAWQKVYDSATITSFRTRRIKWHPQTLFDAWWREECKKTKLSMSHKVLAEMFFKEGWRRAYANWKKCGHPTTPSWTYFQNTTDSNRVLTSLEQDVNENRKWKEFCAADTNRQYDMAVNRYSERNCYNAPSNQMMALAQKAFKYGYSESNHALMSDNIHLLCYLAKETAMQQH